ncbi:MAG: lipoprotein signal peptidase [Bacteroidota bacterium]|jgi:signal peptidase II
MRRPLIIILTVLLIDQALKFWIKTNMYLGQEYRIAGDWFIIHFTENNGMAFGLEFAGEYGKLFLSLFRIVAVFGIGWYLSRLVIEKAHPLLITSMSLILAGAIGNIIDSAFYGIIFSASDFRLAEFLPADGGYSSLLHGKVVDMFYFPIFKGFLPDWIPFWGGDYFIFFRPVFNIADASISIGVGLILIFQSLLFKKEQIQSSDNSSDDTVSQTN